MKTDYQIPGGPSVTADATKAGTLMVHKSLGGRKGYCVTLAATGEVVKWCQLVSGAKALRKDLEALDWGDPGVRELARGVISRHEASTPEGDDDETTA